MTDSGCNLSRITGIRLDHRGLFTLMICLRKQRKIEESQRAWIRGGAVKLCASRDFGSVVCVATGRVLSSLMLALLVIMPLTEYFWHFDGFLSGGQDFEFGLLAALAFFGLVLVLLQNGRQAIRRLMLLCIWRSFVFLRSGSVARGSRIELLVSGYAIFLQSPARLSYTLPIQV